jgi:ATP-dependent exoDNAse (exonuclease V) alpha subunit
VRVPRRLETHHFALAGDTGAGKSTLMLQMARQVRARQESAVVYDAEREFVSDLYDPAVDVILNPFASTRMIAELRGKVKTEDRVMFVGDTRQHQSVEAGRFLESAIAAGMKTVRLEEILRQRDDGLKRAVQLLAAGDSKWAVGELIQQGRVREVANREERIGAIAKDYATSPDRTLVISPDNGTREALNQAVRAELRAKGMLAGEDVVVRVLVERGELTGADRQAAVNYEAGDVVRYSKGSKAFGVAAGEYARVLGVDGKDNVVTVRRSDGQELTYDPRRLQGVCVFTEAERKFAAGERLQFTAPWKSRRVPNRELASIQGIDADGNMCLKLDGGRVVRFNAREHPHLDYGYATTSFSAQGLTSVRAVLNVDTEQSKELVNTRLGYTAVSRASHDVQLYTDDAAALAEKLGRRVTKESVLDIGVKQQMAQGGVTPKSETFGNVTSFIEWGGPRAEMEEKEARV